MSRSATARPAMPTALSGQTRIYASCSEERNRDFAIGVIADRPDVVRSLLPPSTGSLLST